MHTSMPIYSATILNSQRIQMIELSIVQDKFVATTADQPIPLKGWTTLFIQLS